MTTILLHFRDGEELSILVGWITFKELFKSGVYLDRAIEWMQCNGKKIIFE